MSKKKVSSGSLEHVKVQIRSDLLFLAHEQHLDISEECNVALARRLGVEYTGAHPPHSAQEAPVMAAHVPAPKRPVLRPVINADDPATPAQVLREKADPAASKPHAVHHPHIPTGTPSPVIPPRTAEPVQGKPGKPAADKKRKENSIKKFVSSRIVRADDDDGTDAIIPKDELFQRFEDWCRDHAITPVPDRRAFTIALKNQYVIAERTIGGTPYWVNIRLK
jgi:hypothetical protein